MCNTESLNIVISTGEMTSHTNILANGKRVNKVQILHGVYFIKDFNKGWE